MTNPEFSFPNNNHLRRILPRLALAAVCAVGVTQVVPNVFAAPAYADTIQRVEGTGGLGLSLREAPTTGGRKIDTLPEGSEFSVECWTVGQVVDGTNVWERGTAKGHKGYASDRYLNTGAYPTGAQLSARGIPQCDTPGAAHREPLLLGNYNRGKAVEWANQHAKDTPPYPASCTQFVSRALWYAGVRESPDWNDGELRGKNYSVISRPGTVAAWNAEALENYLVEAFPRSHRRELNFNQNSVPDAQIGDVIAYDWDGDNTTDHLSFVVNVAPGNYPEVAEWSALGGTRPTPYARRGWTYSVQNDKWLQQVYGAKIRAKLIHLDTRYKVAPDSDNRA